VSQLRPMPSDVTYNHDQRCRVITLARAALDTTTAPAMPCPTAWPMAKPASWNDCACACHDAAHGGYRGAHCARCRTPTKETT
jgi:hypothetical protein